MTNDDSRSEHTRLRVYLSGAAEPTWRLSLLRPEAHEAYARAVQRIDDEAQLHRALPYGHTMVGPFTIRKRLEAYDLEQRDAHEVARVRNIANVERWRTRGISRADILFAWVPSQWDSWEMGLPTEFAAELGVAHGTGKSVVVATDMEEVLKQSPFLTEIAWKMVVGKTALEAYEQIMADLDVTFERGMVRTLAKYDGSCIYCRSAYRVQDFIFWSKYRGGMHIDCHARLQNDEKTPNAIVFNAELVHVLRDSHAKLERELLELTTKNSMIEQEKALLQNEKEGLKKEIEELYAEYSKWVHP